jgi:hypothetical protein
MTVVVDHTCVPEFLGFHADFGPCRTIADAVFQHFCVAKRRLDFGASRDDGGGFFGTGLEIEQVGIGMAKRQPSALVKHSSLRTNYV